VVTEDPLGAGRAEKGEKQKSEIKVKRFSRSAVHQGQELEYFENSTIVAGT
jgi:hypothetical protein